MIQNEGINPSEVTEMVLENVINYCKNYSDDLPYDCMADYSPDQWSDVIDLFKPDLTKEELEAIEKSDKFWDEVKKEYEKSWKEWWAEEIAYHLGRELKVLYETLAWNDLHLSDLSLIVNRLKAYGELLNGFKDAIRRALKKPLTELELRDWYKKMGEAVYGCKKYMYHRYYSNVTYFLNYYDMLDDNNKLEILSKLLNNDIDKILNEIKQTLSEYNQRLLTNS